MRRAPAARLGIALLGAVFPLGALPASAELLRPPARVSAPFVTAVPWLLPAGAVETDLFATYARHEVAPFENSGDGPIDRNREILGGGAAVGLDSRAEGSFQLGWQETNGDDATNHPQPTDLRLGIGYLVDGRQDTAVTTAIRFAAKVPTAPDRHGAGTDEADLAMTVTSGARTARSGIFGSAGIALLGNPLRHGAQDDIMTFCLAGWLGREQRAQITMEVEGQALSRFHNSPIDLHLGARRIYRQASGRAIGGYVRATRGLDGDASRWGAMIGLAWLSP